MARAFFGRKDIDGTGPRLAVVGASTGDGRRLRERLAEFGVPGSRVDLYGVNQSEAVISEYAGEARLVQEPEPGEISRHDVIFLCEPGDLSCRLARAAKNEAVVIDLVGALEVRPGPPLIHMDVNPQVAENHRGFLAVPHPLTILLADLLAPLEREYGLREAVGVILRPAADFGQAGIDELREQTVRLLNFVEVPSDTFGRQLAFNVIPQARLACDSPRLESRIVDDLASLLQWEQGRVTLRLLAVPVFYGHSIQLRFRLERDATLERIEETIANRPDPRSPTAGTQATPMDVSGEKTTSLYEITEDGLGGYWLLAVAGETDSSGADHAVRLADALSRL